MAFASSQLSFLTRTPLSLPPKHNRKPPLKPLVSRSCSMDKDALSEKVEVKLAKLAMVALAAGTLTLGSVESAVAAKSGGRIGGQAFRSAAPWVSGARINNSRTSIYVNPPVAPPLIGGYGYAVLYYGGWGWSPFTFFMPGPSIAVGVGGGFEVLIAFLVFGAVTAIIRGLFGRRDYEEDDY